MSNYDEHPILKFYNSGLNTPYNKHDIAVSINTDDQGVIFHIVGKRVFFDSFGYWKASDWRV